jgi:hypothetical protein
VLDIADVGEKYGIVVALERDVCYLAYYGNHDNIERFLRKQ